MTLLELSRKFPTESAAHKWFVKARWSKTVACPHCGSLKVTDKSKHPTMPYHCRDCRKFFSVKTGTCMQDSKLGYRTWAFAIYILNTQVKGASSLNLHRILGVSQKTAWFLAHRIRESWAGKRVAFAGPVEVDETYIGGREKNKHYYKKFRYGRGTVGKIPVVGMKDRATNQIAACVSPGTDRESLHLFINGHAHRHAAVYTDEHRGYRGLPRHQVINHGRHEYVRGSVHTNGIESFWALLKRGYYGTYHYWSFKHLERYVNEFAGRHNSRALGVLDRMAATVAGMDGKRLRYTDLVA